jgi:hypothetical protein
LPKIKGTTECRHDQRETRKAEFNASQLILFLSSIANWLYVQPLNSKGLNKKVSGQTN